MRFLTYLMIGFLSVAACKKKVEKTKEDLLLQLIVSGPWTVDKYTLGSNDVTTIFSSYRFQFKKDFTVDAINNGTVENTGTWNGSIDTKTIISNFPNPNPTLSLLNGTWLVTDSGLDYVESKQTVNGEQHFLRLLKK